MLEEKNDNLLEADGNLANESNDSIPTENQEVITETVVEISEEIEAIVPEETSISEEVIEETVTTVSEEVETPTIVEEVVETISEPENVVELTDEQVADDTLIIEDDNHSAITAIQNVNAEESEDETLKDRHHIEMMDYETLSMEELVDELSVLVAVEKVMSVKDHVEELKKSFLSKYYHFIDEKKEEFHAENPETTEDFHYHFPLKIKFDQLYTSYRERKNTHFQSLQNSLKSNLDNRLAIVEELKNLIHSQEAISVTLKQFNDIRERWKVAGPIPKDKYNHVWNN